MKEVSYLGVSVIWVWFTFSSVVNSVDIPYNELVTKLFLHTQVPIPDDVYDFIIVGSSAAGSVLANRLSENINWKVLLLEAGEVPSAFYDVPITGPLTAYSSYSNVVYTPPNSYSCQGLVNKQCKIVYGEGFGGDSGINTLLYARGSKKDYKRWEHVTDSNEWDYDEVLKYFKKCENSMLTEFEDLDFHGHKGLITVENMPYKSPLRNIFMQGAEQAGYAKGDYNGKTQNGFSPIQAMMKKGQRMSAYHAYIEPIVLSRKNLKIISNVEKVQLMFNEKKDKVTGVQFCFKDKSYSVTTSKEVIVSAGALGSPKILLQSGIGPNKHLKELKVELIRDLPVGKSLFDQVLFPGVVVSLNKSALPEEFVERLNTCDSKDYKNGDGKLTLPYNLESIAFLNVHKSSKNDAPNVAIIQDAGSQVLSFQDPSFQKLYNIDPKAFDFENQKRGYFVNLNVVLLHPESRGSVKLQSADHDDKLIVEPKYLKEDEDVDTLVKGIKMAMKLLDTTALKKYNAELVPLYPHECGKLRKTLNFASDAYWRCLVRSIAVPNRSYAGTCSMGKKFDPDAVVSSSFKVHGIHQLRVIDSSVIPVTISGDTTVVEFMLGEKGASMLKKEHCKENDKDDRKLDGVIGTDSD